MDGKDIQQTSWLRAQFPINPASFVEATEPPYKCDLISVPFLHEGEDLELIFLEGSASNSRQ